MNTTFTLRLTLAAFALVLAGCAGMSQNDRNTTTGAVVGGVAGAVLTGGSTVGTLGGAVVGGVIGDKIDTNKK